MAILGKIDAATFANTVAVTNNDATVTKNAADAINSGDVLELGGVAYIVKSITSTTEVELHIPYAGSTDAALAGAVRRTPPKAVAEYVITGGDSASYQLIFADSTEGSLAVNETRGIWGPGWWLYRTFTDAAGNTRHKAECLAHLNVAAGVSGDDDDDAIAADATTTISITAQPADVGAASDPFTGTFGVTASASSGSLLFQWQRQTATSTRWVNVTGSLDGGVYSGQTGATLTITGAAKADLDGYKFRVKLTSDAGAEEVISDAATLTYA